MLQKILDWLVGSSWFKKYSAFFGGYALGVWTMATYWKQIIMTLKVWGIERDTFLSALLFIVGAAGIGTSIGLSVIKSKKEKGQTCSKPPQSV